MQPVTGPGSLGPPGRAERRGPGTRAAVGARGVGSAGGPRPGVPDEEEERDHRPQLQPGPGGCQHGPLQLHLPQTPGDLPRRGGSGRGRRLLPEVSGQERGVRGRCVPAERGAASTAAQAMYLQVSQHKYQDLIYRTVQ